MQEILLSTPYRPIISIEVSTQISTSIAAGLTNISIAIVHENKLYAGCKTANHHCNHTTMAIRLVIPHSDRRWLKADDLRMPKKIDR